jgi:hypothetical protein
MGFGYADLSYEELAVIDQRAYLERVSGMDLTCLAFGERVAKNGAAG